eukprot:2054585-Rhodomonas_salina.2
MGAGIPTRVRMVYGVFKINPRASEKSRAKSEEVYSHLSRYAGRIAVDSCSFFSYTSLVLGRTPNQGVPFQKLREPFRHVADLPILISDNCVVLNLFFQTEHFLKQVLDGRVKCFKISRSGVIEIEAASPLPQIWYAPSSNPQPRCLLLSPLVALPLECQVFLLIAELLPSALLCLERKLDVEVFSP